MNRNWDIFRNSANGVDPSRGTSRFDERTRHRDRRHEDNSEYVFDPPRRHHARGYIPSYGDEGFGRPSQGWAAHGYGHYERDDHHLAHLYDREHDMRFDRSREHEERSDHPSLWQRVKGAFTGKGPKNWVRSDERIREDVCERLADHPAIDASEIEVHVKSGEVTLVGTVDHRRTKRLAEDVTEEVRGIRDIHNQIKVKK